MKDQRQPTTLERLRELVEYLDGEEGMNHDCECDLQAWITWTYNFLSARKQYHRKRQLTQALLIKMSKTLLSPDELARVDQEAEEQLTELDKMGDEHEHEPEPD